jgi:hypothetical protein
VKIGTKSVLFGAHQFLLHPMFLALAWWRLYGFPREVWLWIAFFFGRLESGRNVHRAYTVDKVCIRPAS